MHKFTLALLITFSPLMCLAQPTAEIKNIRIYEHHSSDLNGGQPFGMGADGSKSGYDFVNHTYFDSFDPATMGKWGANDLVNLDMVEHNGPLSGGGASRPFGFTSGTSTIWAGDIAGNNITLYAEAPANFDYAMANDAAYIKDAFPATANQAVPVVAANKVYLAKIRNTEEYVAIKVTNVTNVPPNLNPGVDAASVYFDFDYKYGYYFPTDVKGIEKSGNTFAVYPNPSKGSFVLKDLPQQMNMHTTTLRIIDMVGRTVHTQPLTSTNIRATLPVGNYVVLLTDGSKSFKNRLVIVE